MTTHHIETAARTGDDIWLLYSTGTLHPTGSLVSLDLANGKCEAIHIPSEKVEQFCVVPGGNVLIASSGSDLWRYSDGDLELLGPMPESPLPDLVGKFGIHHQSTLHDIGKSGLFRGHGSWLLRDRILNMVPDGLEIILLTSSAALRYHLKSGVWKIIPLDHLIPKALRMPAVLTGDGYLYQGTCLGEDGGDLKRINTRTGAVELLAEGIQVTSVTRDPWYPGTAMYSMGTWHMGLDKGGIYHTTGGMVPVISSHAVYHHINNENGIIAAMKDGIHRFQSGSSERYDYPEYSSYDGIRVASDERFGTFVLTDIYRSRMVCGAVPLFVG